MGSTRLPGKVLMNIKGKSIIDWILDRVLSSNLIDKVVVAIPSNRANDALYDHLKKRQIDIFRGDEDDVLSRILNAGVYFKAENIIRICADNPLVDSEQLDFLIKFFRDNQCDYCYNHIPKKNKYPDGLGGEISSLKVLKKIDQLAILKNHREHCFSYIWDNLNDFKVLTFNPPDNRIFFPQIRLDVDNIEDYEKICSLDINPKMSSFEIIDAYKKSKYFKLYD